MYAKKVHDQILPLQFLPLQTANVCIAQNTVKDSNETHKNGQFVSKTLIDYSQLPNVKLLRYPLQGKA